MNPVVQLIRELGESSRNSHGREYHHIRRAPAHIRHSRQSDFDPKLVSIGPYHHGRENLQSIENLKVSCARDLIKKKVGPDKVTDLNERDIRGLLRSDFGELERSARESYKENLNHYSSDEFIEMLGIDSCFIIRIMLSFSQKVEESMAFLDVNIKEVRSDLLLLENQIPLFFIRKVYDYIRRSAFKQNHPEFEIVAAQFLFFDMPMAFNRNRMTMDAAHLLDLYWQCSRPLQTIELKHSTKRREQPSWADMGLSIYSHDLIPNATVLHKMAGITFEKKNKDPFLHQEGHVVTFSNGIMKMPYLEMDSCHTRLLVNLIAFENFKLPHMRFYSSYMKLMDALIDSKKDVELLQQCGVIRNKLNSYEMAATFFNDIGNFCVVDDRNNIFSSLYKDVQKYYESKWNHRWASLSHNYFNSPWAGISVVAGATLTILTVFQTVYTILGDYYRH